MKVTLPQFVIVLLMLQLGCVEPSAEWVTPAKSPNFIIILTDDQRFDALGIAQQRQDRIARFPWLTLPTLDSLATVGTYFKNAFVTTSLCSPSRASILTGQLARSHGIRDNNTDFNSPSFVTELGKKGYQTAYFGKWHMGKQKGKRPGFDYSYSFVGQGQYKDAVFEENGEPIQTQGWVDHITTDRAIDQLDQLENDPFCFFIGYKAAHGPWNELPNQSRTVFPGDSIFDVPNVNRRPPAVAESGIYSPPSAEQKRQYMVYFQYLALVDQNVKKLIQKLRTLNQLDNTYLIFLSDNGFFMGEHQIKIDKRLAYDESIRIPMLISGPGVTAHQEEAIVLNIDITPTILNLAGLPNNLRTDGLSMVPLLQQRETTWRKSFVYEYYREQYIGIQSDIFALRDDRYKLIRYPQHPEWDEFFDMENDPYETRNLINEFSYREIIYEMDEKLDMSFR